MKTLIVNVIFVFLVLLVSKKVVSQHPDAIYPIPQNYAQQTWQNINLFNGNFNYPVSLISINGRSISYSLQAQYNSRSAYLNFTDPNGYEFNFLGGNGWKPLDYPKFIQDGNNYYYLDGNRSYLLNEINSDSNTFTYSTGLDYYLWKFERVGSGSSSDRWQITKEDGSGFLFTEPGVDGTYTQWNISRQMEAQWGDTLFFNYGNSNIIQQIWNYLNDTLYFEYSDFGGNNYLTAIIHSRNGTVYGKVLLKYDPISISGNDYYFLSEISSEERIAPGIYDEQSANLDFKYEQSIGNGIITGVMDSVISPGGAVTVLNYTETQTGSITSYPVTEITLNDGYDNNSGDTIDPNIYSFLEYQTSNVAVGEDNIYALFNLVTVNPGGQISSSHEEQHPYGNQEYYYFNTQSASNLTDLPSGYNTSVVNDPTVIGYSYQNKTNNDSLVHDNDEERSSSITYWEKSELNGNSLIPYSRIHKGYAELYGVGQWTTYTYNDEFGLPIAQLGTVSNPKYDQTGDQADSVKVLTVYAMEIYPELGVDGLHMLTPVVKTTNVVQQYGNTSWDTNSCIITQWTQWNSYGTASNSSGKWGEWRYYRMQEKGINTATGFASQPDTDNWLLISQNDSRDSVGNVTSGEGVDSIASYTVFTDPSFGNYILSQFTNTNPLMGEAYYTGFESYEARADTMGTGNVLNYDIAHTGAVSLQTETFIVPITVVGATANYYTSFYYMTDDYVTTILSVSIGGQVLISEELPATYGKWVLYDLIIPVNSDYNGAEITLEIYHPGSGLYLDDFSVMPPGLPFKASVYDMDHKFQSAAIGSNSETDYFVHNRFSQAMGYVGPDTSLQARSLYISYNSRLGNEVFVGEDTFNRNQPNMALMGQARLNGIWAGFDYSTSQYFPDSGLDDMEFTDGYMYSNILTGSEATAVLSTHYALEPDFVVSVEIITDELPKEEKAGIIFGSGNDQLYYNITSNSIQLLDDSGQVLESESIINQPQSITLTINVLNGQHIFAYADGRLVFDYTHSESLSYPIALWTDADSIYFDNFFLINEPILKKTTFDANFDGKQQLIQNTHEQIQVNEKLFGGALNLHKATTHTTYVEASDVGATTIGLSYIEEFSDYNAETQDVDTSSIVAKEFGYNNPYSFSQDYYQSPLLNTSFSGTGGEFAANEKSTQYYYDGDSTGISGMDPNSMVINASLNPDSLLTSNVQNYEGNQMSSMQSYQGDTISAQFEYNGSMQNQKDLMPNFFPDGSDNSSFYRESSYNYVGDKATFRITDAGTKQYIYDPAGRLWFMIDSAGLEASPNEFMYWEYNSLGHPDEAGIYNYDWDSTTLQQYANTNSNPDWPSVWRRQYKYNGNGRSPSIGLITTVRSNNGSDTTADVIENTSYDIYGNITSSSIWVSGYDDITRTVNYTYDLMSNVVTVENPSGETIYYTYDNLGQVTGVGTDDNPYQYAQYQYEDTVYFEILNDSQITRAIDLNPAGWLDQMNDPFYTETLTYTEGGLLDASYYSGLIASSSSSFHWENAPGSYTYKYKYDGFGRLIAGYVVETDSNDVNYLIYDDNSNILVLQRWKDKTLFWNSQDGNSQDIQTTGIMQTTTSSTVNGQSIEIFGMALDPFAQQIYWANDMFQFQRSSLEGSDLQTLPIEIGTYPQGFCLDIFRYEMFIAVPDLGNIVKVNMDGSEQENIIENQMPQNIAVYPSQGRIYWPDGNADEGQPIISIKTAKTDGSDIQTLITLPTDSDPVSGFALDTMRGKMYWSLDDKIQSAYTDGTGMTTLYIGGGNIDQISLDVFNKQVFWTDQQSGAIEKINFDQTGYMTVINDLEEPGYILQNLASNIMEYETGTNKVLGDMGQNDDFVYDGNGNIVQTLGSNPLDTLIYDPLLTTVVEMGIGNSILSLQYGGRMQRVLKTFEDTSTLYVHGINPLPVEELVKTSTDEILTTYIYGSDGLIAFIHNNSTYFVLKDHIGSVRVVLDENNNVLASLNYTPFGELMLNNCWFSPDAPPINYRFTGQEYDSESQLYNFRARMYDPEMARFYSIDPDLQFPSPYVYSSNPVSYTDPSGEWFGWDDAIAIGVGALVGGAIELGKEVITGEDISFKKIAISSAAGAVAGELALYTGGAGAALLGEGLGAEVLGGAVAGSISNVGAQVTTNVLEGNNISDGLGSAALTGALVGGITGGITYKLFKGNNGYRAYLAREGAGERASPLGYAARRGRTRGWRSARNNFPRGTSGAGWVTRNNGWLPERYEVEHWPLAQNHGVGQYLPNSIVHSRFNTSLMWTRQHALLDPFRYRFMPRSFRTANPQPGFFSYWVMRFAYSNNYLKGGMLAVPAATVYTIYRTTGLGGSSTSEHDEL